MRPEEMVGRCYFKSTSQKVLPVGNAKAKWDLVVSHAQNTTQKHRKSIHWWTSCSGNKRHGVGT